MGNQPTTLSALRRPTAKQSRSAAKCSQSLESMPFRGSTPANVGVTELSVSNNANTDSACNCRTCSSGRSPRGCEGRQETQLLDAEFIVHGLDYLPDFEKRRERRKNTARKMLNIDQFSWSASYIQFLHRARTWLRSSAADTAVICTSVLHGSDDSKISACPSIRLSSIAIDAVASRSNSSRTKKLKICKRTSKSTADNGSSNHISCELGDRNCSLGASTQCPCTQVVNDCDDVANNVNCRDDKSVCDSIVRIDTCDCLGDGLDHSCNKPPPVCSVAQQCEATNCASDVYSQSNRQSCAQNTEPSFVCNANVRTSTESICPESGVFISRASTVDSGIDIATSGAVTMDWKNYTGYPFENVVMSGGGSKGYAYIGSLKVPSCLL